MGREEGACGKMRERRDEESVVEKKMHVVTREDTQIERV